MSDAGPAELSHDEIDGAFVPIARDDVVGVELDGETVLGRIPDGAEFLRTHVLNATGTIVWQCFDGSGTLDEIIADLADAFGADVDVVRADVLELAQQVGALGLLVGVREHVAEMSREAMGVPVGLPLPAFEAIDEDGEPFSSDELRGRSVLLVNWSPACGFCRQIVDDLAQVAPALKERGVEIALLAIGDLDANREVLATSVLECRLLLRSGDVDVFGGLGTPCAYLLDDEGTVVEPMALGAIEVPELARRAAGADTH